MTNALSGFVNSKVLQSEGNFVTLVTSLVILLETALRVNEVT